MKNGARSARRPLGSRILAVLLSSTLLSLVALSGCGKSNSIGGSASSPVTGGDDQYAMKGYAAFGSQCSSGFNTDPKAVKLELFSCPLNVSVVELAEPIQPIFLSADCGRKTLTMRSYDRSIDVNWELMPDGSFYLSQEGINAKLKNDGNSHSNCTTPISMDMWGQVSCPASGSDQATIHFETVMWLNKGGSTTGASPSSPSTGNPTGDRASSSASQCSLPVGKCYFHAVSSVKQCS